MDWGSVLDYGLVALKVIGLIGAFSGLASSDDTSRRTEPSTTTPSSQGKLANRRRVAALFLLLAITAELVDATIRHIRDREDAEKFARLIHPLGTIQVTSVFGLTFDDERFQSYFNRLQDCIHPTQQSQQKAVSPCPDNPRIPLPDPKNDSDAFALLRSDVGFWVSVYRHPNPIAAPQVWNRRSPQAGLRFVIRGFPPRGPDGRYTLSESNAQHIAEVIGDKEEFFYRHFVYVESDKMLTFTTPTATVDASDRDADGTIVSTEDFRGSQFLVTICPIASSSDKSLSKHIRLRQLIIELPGRYSLILGKSPLAFSAQYDDDEFCSNWFVTLPSGPKQFADVLVQPFGRPAP